MKKLQRITLGLALLAAVTCGGVSASAKSGNKQRAVNGIVQSVDLRTRTIQVREQNSDRVINVRVPEGALIQTTNTTQSLVQIERLIPGMSLRGLVVE